jgi:hypothetical protein
MSWRAMDSLYCSEWYSVYLLRDMRVYRDVGKVKR